MSRPMFAGIAAGIAMMFSTLCLLGAAGCGTAGQATSMTEGQVTSTTVRPATSATAVRTSTSTTAGPMPAPRVSFIAPRGSGEGQVCYVEDQEGIWGPTGFCVLPDKSVAILGCGDESVRVFGPSGEPLYSIDLRGITITPMDIRWWNDTFAILELNSQPKSVVLIDVKGRVRKTIELWPGMDETSEGGLRIGRNGELELMEPCVPPHVLTDSQGNALPAAQMQQTRATYAFQGGPEFEVAQQQGEGPARARVVGLADWVLVGPEETLGGTPLASDDLGNTYFEVGRVKYDSSGLFVAADTIVVRLDGAFRQVGYARTDSAGMVIAPPRAVDVTGDGNAYSMMPKADGVHIETLDFSTEPPELGPSF